VPKDKSNFALYVNENKKPRAPTLIGPGTCPECGCQLRLAAWVRKDAEEGKPRISGEMEVKNKPENTSEPVVTAGDGLDDLVSGAEASSPPTETPSPARRVNPDEIPF